MAAVNDRMNGDDAPAPRRLDIGGGRRLAVRVQGSGPPVLLEIGAGGGGLGPGWNRLDERVAEFATAIVYDRAGVGGSARAEERPTTADRVRDLAALLDAIPVREKVVLAGWSLGGLIVQHFAALHPARVAGLVLVDPTPVDTYTNATALQRWLMRSGAPARLMIWLARSGLLRRRRMQAGLQRMLEAQLGPRCDRAVLPRLLEAVSSPVLHEAVRMESARLAESCDAVARLAPQMPRVPLIVLTAGYRGKGAMAKASARVGQSHARLATSIPGGELRVLADVSHHVPFEAPDAIVQAVRDVIARR